MIDFDIMKSEVEKNYREDKEFIEAAHSRGNPADIEVDCPKYTYHYIYFPSAPNTIKCLVKWKNKGYVVFIDKDNKAGFLPIAFV